MHLKLMPKLEKFFQHSSVGIQGHIPLMGHIPPMVHLWCTPHTVHGQLPSFHSWSEFSPPIRPTHSINYLFQPLEDISLFQQFDYQLPAHYLDFDYETNPMLKLIPIVFSYLDSDHSILKRQTLSSQAQLHIIVGRKPSPDFITIQILQRLVTKPSPIFNLHIYILGILSTCMITPLTTPLIIIPSPGMHYHGSMQILPRVNQVLNVTKKNLVLFGDTVITVLIRCVKGTSQEWAVVARRGSKRYCIIKDREIQILNHYYRKHSTAISLQAVP